MLKWLHHLFNPHCEFCRLERECKNCDMMKEELAKERAEKMVVLNKLLELNTAPRFVEPIPPSADFKPIQIGRKHIPWDVRRAELEAQHRLTTEKTDNREKEIEALEEKLGVKDAIK